MGAALGCAFCKDKTPVLDLSDKVKFMSAVPLFKKKLDEDDLKNLADTAKTVTYAKGTVIYHQGDYGNDLFIIAQGQVAVSIDGNKVAYKLNAGDHFGENALLRHCPRTVTVTTETVLQAVKVARHKFQELGLHQKLDFPKRKAAAGHAPEHKVVTKPASPKTEDDIAVIFNAIRTNPDLDGIFDLDDAHCKIMCDAAWERTVAEGEVVIEEGSNEHDFFYIIKQGTFQIAVNVDDDDDVRNEDHAVHSHIHQVGSVGAGKTFGSQAMLTGAPRRHTVKASEPSTLWVIDRITFKRACQRKADYYAQIYSGYLKTSEQFGSLKDDERMSVAKSLLESNYSKGEYISEQGEEGTTFYILYEGEVSVTKDGKEIVKLVGKSDKVEIFGELALINGEPHPASVQVTSETAKALSMDRDSFELLLGPVAAILSRGEDAGVSLVGKSTYSTSLSKSSRIEANGTKGKIYYDDLQKLGLLGCGGFGYVELVESKKTGQTYALKTLSKGWIIQNHQEKEVLKEKNVQMRCDSPFIIRLYETYNWEQSLCLLLELGLGGELHATYLDKKFWGSWQHALFYTAGVVMAFDHMHRKKVIYRDLKPENILFDEKGNSKLTDMGLATICAGKTFTVCGTADYMAPEVMSQSGHNHAADWWALGVMTFELMVGHPPFHAHNVPLIMASIKKGINQVKFDPNAAPELKSFVKAMCQEDPANRLPMKKGGVDKVKAHDFYSGFDWDALRHGTLTPPYVPEVKSRTDLANFKALEEDKPPHVDYEDDGSGWDQDFATSRLLKGEKQPK